MEDVNKWEEIISSKFDEPEFPFDEENWEKAEAMLDKRLRREKFRKVFFIYFSGLLTGLLLMFLGLKIFSGDNTKQPQTGLVASNQSSRTIDQNNAADPSSSRSGTSHSTDEDGDQLKNKQDGSDQSSAADIMNADAPHSDQPAGKTSVNSGTNDVNSGSGSHDQSSNVSSTDPNQQASSSHSQNSNSQASSNSNDHHGDIVVRHGLTSDDVSSISGVGIVSDDQSSLASNAQVSQPADVNMQSAAVVHVNETDSAATEPVYSDVDSAFAQQVDSMYAKHSGFSLEAGTNFNMGWSYSDSANEGRGFNPVAGIAYTAHFGPDWTLRTSVRYENYGHFHVSRLETVDATPGFGKFNIDTTIIPHSLHYFNVPLTLERRINRRSFIGVGASYAFLFTTRSRTEVWREMNGDDLQVITPGTAYGYMNGFNSWDLDLNIAYQYQLKPHIGLRLEGSFGLHEFKNNTLYASPKSQMDRVFAFRLMLTYNFGKQ